MMNSVARVFPSQRLSSPPLLPLLALSFQTLRSRASLVPVTLNTVFGKASQ